MNCSDDNIIIAVAIVLVILIVLYAVNRCTKTSWYGRMWGNYGCSSCGGYKSRFSGKEGCACRR